MRVVYVHASPVPSDRANAVQVAKMCDAFAQAGHEVTLVCPPPRLGTEGADDFRERFGLSAPFAVEHLAHGDGLNTLVFVVQAVRVARRRGADVLYTRDIRVAALAAQLGMATVYEAHDRPRGRGVRVWYPLFFHARGARRFVAISDALRRRFVATFTTALGNLDVVVAHDAAELPPAGQSPARKEARAAVGLDGDAFVVGYVGHLYEGRGVEQIIEAAERLRDVRFLMVGGTPDDVARHEQAARERGLSNLVWVGRVPHRDVPQYLAACDVLLMPYQSRVLVGGGEDTSEGMSPMKMFEYMAAERLIVSSDLPVLREVLDEGNAVLVPPTDVDAWVGAIDKARRDPAWRERLAAQARADAAEHSWERRVDRVLAGLDNRGKPR